MEANLQPTEDIKKDSEPKIEEEQTEKPAGRGVMAQPPAEEDLSKDFDKKLKVKEEDSEAKEGESPNVQQRRNLFVQEQLANSEGFKLGSIDGGMTFSTSDSRPAEEEKKEESSSTIASSTPSTKKKSTNKSTFFSDIEPSEMTAILTQLQLDDPEEFKTIMTTGKELLKCAEENDVAGYHSRMIE